MKQLLFIILVFTGLISKAQAPTDSTPTHLSFTFRSEVLNETRTINVWLPPGYELRKQALPVLYMLDGGIREDFPHIASSLSQLIKERKVKPRILVGIENTQRRRDLTGFTEVAEDKKIAAVVGGSELFRRFIRTELFPEISRRYSCTKERGIIGESLAGLFILETLFLDPEMFDQYIAFDPSLWWNHHYWVRMMQAGKVNFPKQAASLWFAGSAETLIYPFTREIAAMLKSSAPANLRWQYADEPGETHPTIFKATKEKAMIWTFQ